MVCRKLVDYSATSAGTERQKLGIFTWQARGRFSQKLVDISAASAGAVKSETCVWTLRWAIASSVGVKVSVDGLGRWETKLQGRDMQGSSGSMEFSLLTVFKASYLSDLIYVSCSSWCNGLRSGSDAGISQPLHVMATGHVAADCHVPVLAGLPTVAGVAVPTVGAPASSYWQSCDLDKYI